MKPVNRVFIISRADSIGDVVLTLPVAGVLRSLYPDARILFLGRSYTEALINTCEHVDGFINWDEYKQLSFAARAQKLAGLHADTIIHVFPDQDIALAARQAGIALRIGTRNRFFHWFTCNRLVKLSRRRSVYHEAQLNLQLLTSLGAQKLYSLEDIGMLYGMTVFAPLSPVLHNMLDTARINLILHPKSRGSAREWGLENFSRLIRLLPEEEYKIFITGTAAEGNMVRRLFEEHPRVVDITGKLSLAQLISFISKADGLVAASTGPLHIAAASGVNTVGIFPPMKPIDPCRWGPVGKHTRVLVKDKNCSDCRSSQDCACMRDILPEQVRDSLLTLLKRPKKRLQE